MQKSTEINNPSNILSIYASTIDDKELERIYHEMRSIRNKHFILNIEGEKFKVITEHAYLEVERIRKNRILKDSVKKLVRVNGKVDNVKMYDNTALFCLSPCQINEIDIGHTWVRYSPEFRGVKFASQVNLPA